MLFEPLGLSGRALSWANWISVALLIYLLITAVSVIGSGFKTATGGQAEQLFTFASNPLVALVIGVMATALIQSSSTVTSIVVGMVAGGLPIATAIPMLMGANLGTTVTSTLVSLGMAGDKKTFQRAFAAASIHDMFNILSVLILFPAEMVFGILEKSSGWLAGQLTGSDGGPIAAVLGGLGNAVAAVTDPPADLIIGVTTNVLPGVWAGIVLIVVGIVLILFSITLIGKMLKVLMVGWANEILQKSVGRGPISGILAGLLMTVLFQSSSTTTSLIVPLAGSGTFTLRQVYPFTLGANVGTTLTALIAAFAFPGIEGEMALRGALVHVLYNVIALLIIYGLPFLRPFPVMGASKLAEYGVKSKLYVATWVLGVFFIVPGLLILISARL